MSMLMDSYTSFLVSQKEPMWMRAERYNYCDAYFEGQLFDKTPRRHLPLFHNMLSRFLHN